MTSQLTEEERNLARFFLINFKASPDIARRFFDGVFPPTHLAQTINSSMRAIINLNKSKRINAAQLEILRCIPGTVWPSYLPPMTVGTKTTSSKDFDLTMMICLLRNLGGLLTPSNGWDQLPHPNDTLPGAALATLKWYRNQLAHTTLTSMDNNEFTDKWTRVEKALTSLNNGQKPHEVTEILNYDLAGEQAKTLANAELKQLTKEYLDCEKEKEQIEDDFSHYREGNLPKNIADANATFVETWLIDDESFHETEGSKLVYAKVQDCNCILVTSNSGLGKTATIRHIALKYKLEGYEIVPVESPEDIIKYKKNKKQVFIMDDVLGKYDLSPTLLEEWERINEKLMNCFETELDSNKILCTLRLQIARHKRFKNASTILNKGVINLEHESNALSKEEKLKILMKHLKKNNLEMEIKREEVEIMCETNYAFPLLCKLVSDDEERFKNRIAFFRQPLLLLRNELDKICNENKKLYCILVICMLYNGSFSRSIFDIDSVECDEKIDRIMQTCGLQRYMSKKELEDSAVSALGSYFVKDSNFFRFIHDSLEETVGYHFFTFDPRVMLSDCGILFIRDRVRVHSYENMNENVDENIVIIQEDELNEEHLAPLYTRMWTELNNGRFSSLLMSHLFKNRKFVHIFGTHLKNNQSILGSKNTFWKTVSSERRESSNQSVFENVLKILSNHELEDNRDAISRVIDANSTFRSTLLNWIVAFGCYELFQYAWSKMTTFDRTLILGNDFIFNSLPPCDKLKSFFPLAVLGGSLDIVIQLMRSGADVNCFSEFWETPLYIAVKSGRFDLVRLLLRNGAQINLRGWFTMNIPISVTSNKHQLTSLILECDLNQTELHEAVRQNNLEKLKSNIHSDNIDYKTKSGWTVLHYAVSLNNLEAVKVLFHEELSQNDDSYFDFTIDDQRELVCKEPTPNVNVVDNNGLTAVHLAVINDNIEILSLLLRKKAEINVRDVLHRNPLHYIKSESATKLLLTYSSRNQCLETNRNAEEEGEHVKTPMSAFKTMCFNITLQTSLRNVCRDCVNVPDREGNTPLHSVINRRHLKEVNSNCIDTLLANGANPYLFNYRGTLALELIENSCDTVKYINNSAKHKQSIEKTYKVFALFMFFVMGVTFCLSIHLSSIIRKESKNAFFCVGHVAESGNITLVQVTRSINVILLAIVLLWVLSRTFYIRFSNLFWRCLYLFLVLILLGCVFLIFFGPFAYIQIIYRVMYAMIYGGVMFSILIKTFETFLHLRGYLVFLMLGFPQILCFFSPLVLNYTSTGNLLKFNNFDSMPNINTLTKTTSNCTEFSSGNISCTSLAFNITYKNGADFSEQCRTDPNITSYNNTHGTLTVESALIDWQEICLVSLFCFNLSLHATCAYCFLQCILVLFMKIFKGKNTFLLLNLGAMVVLYFDISFQIFK